MVSEATGVALHPFSRKLSVSMEGTELTQRSLHPHPARHSSSLFANSCDGTNINFAAPSHLSACLLESSSSASTVDSDDVTADDCTQSKERDRHASDNGVLQSRGRSVTGLGVGRWRQVNDGVGGGGNGDRSVTEGWGVETGQ